ncbi:hypothetical protein O6P43_005800 [Quillaja saponaria]|uniref:Uncharacterized protein n=1 Tax=Quillaja saponaria TaxID=32244 RepID=A0AAD7Q6V5_QUISA|nr:hypothetical protein O6P43_005800 [Quillaja saponaria]
MLRDIAQSSPKTRSSVFDSSSPTLLFTLAYFWKLESDSVLARISEHQVATVPSLQTTTLNPLKRLH